ncbi:MAG: type II secretion system protein GspL [Rhodocyclaceae bacterium]
MSAMRVDLLRVMLPPALAQPPQPLRCAARLPDGAWHADALPDADALAARYRPKRLEVCSHPADTAMTEVELPPLPSNKLRLAVHGAVELLALSTPEHLAIGFGSRRGGKVPLAWIAATHLDHMQSALSRCGLRVDAIYPPSAFLPSPGDAEQDTTAHAALIDDWIVLRTGVDRGGHCPVADGHDAAAQDKRLRTDLPPSCALQWHDETTMWSGTGWPWTMAGTPTTRREARWLRPALGWGMAAIFVWLAGLNLYAYRVESEGLALRRSMVAQVKAAFPKVPVVLNPLQQARQLRDARKAGNTPVVSSDFEALINASTALLAQSNGQVERLTYRDGALEFQWREGAALTAAELETLRAQAAERGLLIEPQDNGLRLHGAPPADAAPPPTPSAEAAS